MNPKNFDSWQHTRDLIRKGHNRDLNRFLLDVKDEDKLSNKRAHIKKALRINDRDNGVEIANKQIYFRLGLGGADEKIKAVASFPERWATKPLSNVPQLVIVFRKVKASKSGNYQLVIPHYNGSRKPIVSYHTKGNRIGTLTLKDNSTLVINAISDREVERVINRLKPFIDKRYLTDDLKITERKGAKIAQDQYRPLRADFYPQGQENSVAQWQFFF